MKKAGKITALLLAGTMMGSALSGCGNKKKAETGEIPMLKDGETYTPQKDMEITVWQTQGSDYVAPAQPKNDVVQNWLVDKTRVKVVNAYGNGGGQWEAVLARLIAGDNFPEIVACGGGQGPTHFNRLNQANQIWELTPEMLQTYAPDVWEKVPQSMWERMKVDGKIYGIPYLFGADKAIDPNITDEEIEMWGTVQSEYGTQLWIRDDIAKMLYPDCMDYEDCMNLLEKKGAPIGDELVDIPINSTDDLVNLMKKIKDLNLTAGNKPVYAFGYAGADCWVPFARLGPEMMGYNGHTYTSSWNPKTKEIRLPLVEDVVKEAGLLQNQLIRENVIDPESLVHTDAQCKEKILNGQYAIAVLSAIMHPPTINDTLATNGREFRYRPLYTHVPAREGYELTRTMPSWGASIGILKAVSAEDIPQILNWINTQFTDEYEEIRYWGPPEAELYTDNPDGTRYFKNDKYNRLFINHESVEFDEDEKLGLNGTVGLFSVKFRQDTKWDPMMYNHVKQYQLTSGTGGKFSADGPYAKKGILSPPDDAWSAEYAGLESVTKYWSSRSQWEEPFKITLAAKSDEEFEQKWQAAIDNLYSIVDVDAMCKEMTEIARGIELIE